eukprot:gene23416-30690_t
MAAPEDSAQPSAFVNASESEPMQSEPMVSITIPAAENKDAKSKTPMAKKDVSVVAKRGDKLLLNNVSGQLDGGFCAIMGPSGCGKTTLLNTLACRLDRDTEACGEIRLNGMEYSNRELKCIGGYVMQDDVLNTALTVQETLDFSAELRLPASYTKAMRDMEVERVMGLMSLTHTASTIIGNPLQKGISGGERKRVCIAMELITHPQLLFLDEPTSGLDSVSAKSICTTLQKMGAAGECTVVCTIHQPQAKIFRLFHNLLLLKRGRIMYQGPAAEAVAHFEKLGHTCPPHENPADHLMDILTPMQQEADKPIIDLHQRRAASLEIGNKFHSAYLESAPIIDLHQGAVRPLYMVREVIPWHHQFMVLLRRSMKEQWRKRGILLTSLLQTVVIAVLIGTTYFKIGTSQNSLTKRQPVLFFCTINQGMFGALMVINSFPAERVVSLRERAAGSYYVSAYFFAKSVSEMVFQAIVPVIFSLTVYFLVGFQASAGKFFIFTAFMMLCNAAAVSMATMISAVFRTTDMAVTILPMVLEVSRLYGGFFVSPEAMPEYFKWLEAMSYCTYTYVAISQNELNGLDLHCTEQQLNAIGECPTTSGEQVVDRLGLDYVSIPQCAGILISYIAITRALAYLGLSPIGLLNPLSLLDPTSPNGAEFQTTVAMAALCSTQPHPAPV